MNTCMQSYPILTGIAMGIGIGFVTSITTIALIECVRWVLKP